MVYSHAPFIPEEEFNKYLSVDGGDTNSLTVHKVHSKGKNFHKQHNSVFGSIQTKYQEYQILLDEYSELERIYLHNRNLPIAMGPKFHRFVQAQPAANPDGVSSNLNNPAVTDSVYIRNNNHHVSLVGLDQSEIYQSGACNSPYYSFKDQSQMIQTFKADCTNYTKVNITNTQGKHIFTSYANFYGKQANLGKGGSTTDSEKYFIFVDDSNKSPENRTINTTVQIIPNKLYYTALNENGFNKLNKNQFKNDDKLIGYTVPDDLKDADIAYIGLPNEPLFVPWDRKDLTELNDYLMNDDTKVFKYVEGVVLKQNKVSADYKSAPTPVEYIQCYEKNDGGVEMYGSVGIVNSSSDFVSNAFSKVKDKNKPSVRLYARLKYLEKDSKNLCDAVSNDKIAQDNDFVYVDDSNKDKFITTNPNSYLDYQPFLDGTDEKGVIYTKRWCDFGTGTNKAGATMLDKLEKAKALSRFIMQELHLFNLFQYGTVVALSSTVTPDQVEVSGNNVVPAEDQTLQTTPSPESSGKYFVFPINADLNSPPQTTIKISDTKSDSGIHTHVSNFVLYPWTTENLDKTKDYSSGRRFQGLTADAYQAIAKGLKTNYDLIESDSKELNKIAAMQEDLTAIGKMNYYRMIVYVIVMFFLLVCIYYISR